MLKDGESREVYLQLTGAVQPGWGRDPFRDLETEVKTCPVLRLLHDRKEEWEASSCPQTVLPEPTTSGQGPARGKSASLLGQCTQPISVHSGC